MNDDENDTEITANERTLVRLQLRCEESKFKPGRRPRGGELAEAAEEIQRRSKESR